MQKISQEEARYFVLRRLLGKNCIGAKQMLLENIGRSAREAKRIVEKEALRLGSEGILFLKKKHYGVHVSLNPDKLRDVRSFMYSFELKMGTDFQAQR